MYVLAFLFMTIKYCWTPERLTNSVLWVHVIGMRPARFLGNNVMWMELITLLLQYTYSMFQCWRPFISGDIFLFVNFNL